MVLSPTKFYDRHKYIQLVEQALDELSARESTVDVYEITGIPGIGKTRILDEISRRCMEEQHRWDLPVLVLDFLVHPSTDHDQYMLDEQAQSEIFTHFMTLMLDACHQLRPHYPEIDGPRSALQRSLHSLPVGEDGRAATISAFHQQLVEAVNGRPFVVLLDTLEKCATEVLICIGENFIAPLLNAHNPLLVFAAGRAQRIQDLWPKLIRIKQVQLAPFAFRDLDEFFDDLLLKQHHSLIQDIYSLTGGHAYSTEAIVDHLNSLGVAVDREASTTHELARTLYEKVIQQYILVNAPTWVLSLCETTCVVRRFDGAIVARLLELRQDEPFANRQPGWWQYRILDLRSPPFQLIQADEGTPAYSLEPGLRRLLHAALAQLSRPELLSFHAKALEIWEDALTDLDRYQILPHTAICEILYHTAQIAALTGDDVKARVRAVLTAKTRALFPHETFDQSRIKIVENLALRLDEDGDLTALLGREFMQEMLALVNDYRVPAKSETPERRPVYLQIQFTPPTEYYDSWNQEGDRRVQEGRVASAIRFSLDAWRKQTEETGKTAFNLYLPVRAQQFIQNTRGCSTQITTNKVDIPWELLHDGTDFLCLSQPVARRPRAANDVAAPHQHAPDEPIRALVIGDTRGDLPGAAAEAQAVHDLFTAAGIETELLLDAECLGDVFVQRLVNRRYRFIHFAGHGYYDPADPSRSGLTFADSPVFASDLERTLKSQAFVFFNACTAGRAESIQSTTGIRGTFIEGLSASAIAGGALGCLGPLWDISDSVAKDFALEFYRRVLAGLPIGAAVREARLSVRDRSVDFWAAWVLYGDPVEQIPVPKGCSSSIE